jgi:hypothetical protein
MARKRRPDDTVNLRLRLPEALRKALDAEAEKANRSLNSEILWRLGQTFGEEWQRFIAGVEEREKSEQEHRQKMVEQLLQDPEFMAMIDRLGKGKR